MELTPEVSSARVRMIFKDKVLLKPLGEWPDLVLELGLFENDLNESVNIGMFSELGLYLTLFETRLRMI